MGKRSNEEWQELIGKPVRINDGAFFGYVQDVRFYENPKTSALYLGCCLKTPVSQWMVVWLHEIKKLKEMKVK